MNNEELVREKRFSLLDIFPAEDATLSLLEMVELRQAIIAGLKVFAKSSEAWERGFVKGSCGTVRTYLKWIEHMEPYFSKEMENIDKRLRNALDEFGDDDVSNDEPKVN